MTSPALERSPALTPSRLARLPFYYGWVNVAVAAVAMSATLPGRTYGLGLIKEPLRLDVGLSDLQFNLLNFWAIVLGSALCLPIGRLIDRFGARVVLAGVAAALGGCVVLMSRVTDPTNLFLTLTLVRGLGQGALSVVSIALVGMWFKRRAGPAMGVFTVLLAFGFVAPIFVVGAAAQRAGWRTAWEWVGLALLFSLAPFGWLLARSSPEACGVSPDEPILGEADAGGVPATLRDVLRTPAFWAYTLAATLFNLTFSALTLDNEALLQEHGLDGQSANELILGVLMFSGLPANLLAGGLARRLPMGRLLAIGMAILAASLAFFPGIGNLAGAVVYAVLLGAAGGIITVIWFAVYGHTYGRAHLGSIQATAQVLGVLASASGPVVLAACRQWHGSSAPFFFGSAVLAAGLAVAAWIVRPPSRGPSAKGDPDHA